MNKLDLQEHENGWSYQLYTPQGKLITGGHVDSDTLEEAVDEIDTILFGIYEIGQVIFWQKNKAPTI